MLWMRMKMTKTTMRKISVEERKLNRIREGTTKAPISIINTTKSNIMQGATVVTTTVIILINMVDISISSSISLTTDITLNKSLSSHSSSKSILPRRLSTQVYLFSK